MDHATDIELFSVIEFGDEKGYIATVPQKWLFHKTTSLIATRWPRKEINISYAVKTQKDAQEDWPVHNVKRIIATFSNYADALKKEKKYEITSSSEADCYTKVKRKPKKVQSNDFDYYEIESPPPSLEHLSIEAEDDNDADASCNNITLLDYQSTSSPTQPSIRQDKRNRSQTSANKTNENYEIFDIPIGTADCEQPIPENTSSETLMEHILEVKTYVKLLNQRLTNIEKILQNKFSSAVPDEIETELLPEFPLRNILDLEDFEEKLLQNNVKKQFISYVSRIGGANIRDLAKRILSDIFHDELGRQCSWRGQKENYKLANLKVMEYIKAGMRQTFSGLTNREYETAVMEWFRHSNTRLKRKK